jgi:hypothetical protein
VRWSNLLAGAQAKCVPRNLTLDVGKKIFVCLNAQGRGSILPIDYKCAPGVDVSKRANLAFVGFDMAVASNSRQPASGDESETSGKKCNRDFLHVK